MRVDQLEVIQNALRVQLERAKIGKGVRGIIVSADSHIALERYVPNVMEDGTSYPWAEVSVKNTSNLAVWLADAVAAALEDTADVDFHQPFHDFPETYATSPDCSLNDDVIESVLIKGAIIAQRLRLPLLISISSFDLLTKDQMSVLVRGVHLAGQQNLPLIFLGVGSGETRGLLGEAAPYTERLFRYFQIGDLE